MLPVAGTAFQVSDRDDNGLARAKSIDQLVRKPRHEQSTRLLIGRHRTPRFWVLRDEVDRVGDLVQKFGAKTGTLRFVPTDGFGELCCSVGMGTY